MTSYQGYSPAIPSNRYWAQGHDSATGSEFDDVSFAESDDEQEKFFYFPEKGDTRTHGEFLSKGEQAELLESTRVSVSRKCFMGCCPCLTGELCSTEKVLEYKKAGKTFCFLISFVQFVLFLVSISIGGIASPSINPAIGPQRHILLNFGAKEGHHMTKWQLWRFITPIFLHSGLVELLFNLYIQLRVGLYLEQRWRWYAYAVVYMVSGVGAVVAGSLLQPSQIAVASSAACLGTLGAHLMEIMFSWHMSEDWQRKVSLILCSLSIAIELVIGFMPFMDISTQLGGLTVGLLFGINFFAKESPSEFGRKYMPTVAGAALVFYFVFGFFLFFTVVVPIES